MGRLSKIRSRLGLGGDEADQADRLEPVADPDSPTPSTSADIDELGHKVEPTDDAAGDAFIKFGTIAGESDPGDPEAAVENFFKIGTIAGESEESLPTGEDDQIGVGELQVDPGDPEAGIGTIYKLETIAGESEVDLPAGEDDQIGVGEVQNPNIEPAPEPPQTLETGGAEPDALEYELKPVQVTSFEVSNAGMDDAPAPSDGTTEHLGVGEVQTPNIEPAPEPPQTLETGGAEPDALEYELKPVQVTSFQVNASGMIDTEPDDLAVAPGGAEEVGGSPPADGHEVGGAAPNAVGEVGGTPPDESQDVGSPPADDHEVGAAARDAVGEAAGTSPDDSYEGGTAESFFDVFSDDPEDPTTVAPISEADPADVRATVEAGLDDAPDLDMEPDGGVGDDSVLDD